MVAHAAEGAGFLRVAIDGLVGGADGFFETGDGRDGKGCFGWDAAGFGEGVEEGFEGEMAGDFSGSGTSHAVADDEDAVLGAGSGGVLVGVADAAVVGEGCEGARMGRGFVGLRLGMGQG